MSPKNRVVTVTAAGLFMAGFSVGPVFAAESVDETVPDASEETEEKAESPEAESPEAESPETELPEIEIPESELSPVVEDVVDDVVSTLPYEPSDEGDSPDPEDGEDPPEDGEDPPEDGEDPPPDDEDPTDPPPDDEDPTDPPPDDGEDPSDPSEDGTDPGDDLQPPAGSAPGDSAPESTTPTGSAGGGGETLAATGVDMSGFVLGGAVVTGIGALALWAGSRRPGTVE